MQGRSDTGSKVIRFPGAGPQERSDIELAHAGGTVPIDGGRLSR